MTDLRSDRIVRLEEERKVMINRIKELEDTLGRIVAHSYDRDATKQTLELMARKAIKGDS